MRTLNAGAAVLFAAALLVVSLASPTGARDAGPPLGKTNFAIALGGLDAASRTNWVRLGMYTFAPDGSVSEKHWSWSQAVRAARASTGNPAVDCAGRACTVLTAAGWQSSAAARTMTGTYGLRGDELHIAWDGGHMEDWKLTSLAGGDLAGVELAANDLGATHGFGNGSNAPWNSRVPASTIAAADHGTFVHRYYLWKAGRIDHGDGSPFWVTHWNLCADHRCLGAQTHTVDDPVHTAYYISPAGTSSGHRRDTLWHWHTDLADARHELCYTGNSHVKPMIQIVDDEGRFHGWVGVEASLNQTTATGADGDHIGVFRILGLGGPQESGPVTASAAATSEPSRTSAVAAAISGAR
ncbi:hypothetical protein [Spirillospora sp. CA-128828]|uniref:hypothetical protein n=1 Tax=Spirillospora sp. CA-128828 TaxID=3240033 RepID=UPI003D8C6BFB